MKKVIAILCSDLHLSHVAPVARSAENNWYAAMARALQELRELAEEHDVPVNIPELFGVGLDPTGTWDLSYNINTRWQVRE